MYLRPRATRSSTASTGPPSLLQPAVYSLMVVFAFAGGFLTANVGSGSGALLYLFGLYVWNLAFPEEAKVENVYTASSVVVRRLG